MAGIVRGSVEIEKYRTTLRSPCPAARTAGGASWGRGARAAKSGAESETRRLVEIADSTTTAAAPVAPQSAEPPAQGRKRPSETDLQHEELEKILELALHGARCQHGRRQCREGYRRDVVRAWLRWNCIPRVLRTGGGAEKAACYGF